MENFDWRKMSKLTFPSGANETEYLRFEANGTLCFPHIRWKSV